MQSQQVNEGTRVVDSRLQKMGMVSNACVVSGGNALRLNWFSAQLSPQRQCTAGLQKADTAHRRPTNVVAAGSPSDSKWPDVRAIYSNRRHFLSTCARKCLFILRTWCHHQERFVRSVVSHWKCLFVDRNMNWGHGVITEKNLSVKFPRSRIQFYRNTD